MFGTDRGNASREYTARILKVTDYIEDRLGEALTLDELAGVAGFSKYHFHRIFQAYAGETLFGYIQRLRLEKAAYLLVSDRHASITGIALATGFTGSSSFARGFKQHFGVSPSEWRRTRCEGGSNFGIMDRKTGQRESNRAQSSEASRIYIEYAGPIQRWRYEMETMNRVVEVKEIPGWTVAYVRYTGPYAGDGELFAGLYDKLFKWAGARGLVRFPETQNLVVYHDNPDITEKDKLRISVCLTVPEDTETDGEIGKMKVAGGKYAFARFTLGASEFTEAWGWVYGEWLPSSGYVPDDRPCFELYYGEPDAQGRFTLDICVPVKPM